MQIKIKNMQEGKTLWDIFHIICHISHYLLSFMMAAVFELPHIHVQRSVPGTPPSKAKLRSFLLFVIQKSESSRCIYSTKVGTTQMAFPVFSLDNTNSLDFYE